MYTKRKEHINLTQKIKSYSLEISPYSRYQRQDRKYIVEEGKSTHCSEYVRAGLSCDMNYLPSKGDQLSLDYQFENLDEQEELAIRAQEEAIARILYLRKQKAFLKKHHKEILLQGLQTLDKLDALEQKENKEKEKREREEQEAIVQRGNPQEYKDPYSDYDSTLIARLTGLPANDPLQLSDFNPYVLPIGYYSYATLDSIIATQGLSSETPLTSQSN